MIELHPGTSVPLYQQLYDSILSKVSSGEYPQGTKIPSEDELCRAYNVSRVTVRTAIKHLVEDGILLKRRGMGTYVSLSVFVEAKAGGSFTKSCLANGVTPQTKVLSVDMLPAGKETACLRSERVWQIQRLRCINESPVILEIDYFREKDQFVSETDLSNQPITDIIRSKTGLSPCEFSDCFEIVTADENLAELLCCSEGTPILKVLQTVMTSNRQVLYYNEQYILTKKYKYVVNYM